MRAHVGKRIKEIAFEKRMETKKLAKAVGMSVPALNKLFKRAVIHPKWIPAFNKALEHNFWQYYDSREAPDKPKADPEEIAALKNQIAELKKELAYVKEISALLRKKG